MGTHTKQNKTEGSKKSYTLYAEAVLNELNMWWKKYDKRISITGNISTK